MGVLGFGLCVRRICVVERRRDCLECKEQDMSGYKFYAPPQPVGYYRIGGPNGLCIHFTSKPNWFHRTMMRLCLGWEWVDDIANQLRARGNK